MNKYILIPFALLLGACSNLIGTTTEGEKRVTTAGGTFVELKLCIPQPEGECIPATLRWDDAKSKGDISVTMWNPYAEGEQRVFEYKATDVAQPEEVMKLLATVKAQIAEANTGMATDMVDKLAEGAVKALLGNP
tara:strand:- start:97 stop:501 length:405 start_codon:yes stop_codon:yes gene_type:complete